MDTSRLKSFAVNARRSLKQMVAERMSFVLADGSPARRENPAAIAQLEKELTRRSRDAVVDFVAYTWFNRFCALRFMDVKGYNPVRIVSPLPGHSQPEILEDAKSGNFVSDFLTESKKTERIRGLLNGVIASADAQTEAYKLLLVSACNAYNRPMPFLFQHIDDFTELLMPDDLLSDNSILAATRNAILPEVAECGVEVIGWLYQFYISEKKDEVIGKTVRTEDIPAATQLFTPDWIVQYLVQNSLGRLWMLNHPNSALAEQMEYYIPPADGDRDFLAVRSPEDLKVCDPCCGSGHMLTYAFDLLVKIYEEEGYERRSIPSLILTRNLHGIEIDPRAGELAAFALTMKAREYDSRFLRRGNAPYPQIRVLENIDREWPIVSGMAADASHHAGCQKDGLMHDLNLFRQADCMGSLLCPVLSSPQIEALTEYFSCHWPKRSEHEDLWANEEYVDLQKALVQADFLSRKYHVVVTNPPYMGGKGMNADLKQFAESKFPDSKSDLFAMFIERGFEMILRQGYSAMVTMQSWMFLSSFEKLRTKLLDGYTIECLCHMANMVMGIAFGTSATVWKNQFVPGYKGAFCFVEYEDIEDGRPVEFPPDNERNRAAIRRNSEAEKAAMFKEAVR